mmetsp:Transcript_32424/g.71638  ORF Transcript_32424/g.71638 Transcript_32424/m.71638 type:complete len:756 (-) Transcript_32424:233-2500(-)|eukprot:CAMPEP_0202910528 /NCGR_PEP_ID=MMETSP1392-20130828/52267_1 /ASSEMBLY_ACC=CAM_ASM_000868 /TAXON_ID=225041 /ORGANISM="Chlamydomonas chlamydogama, Strain SAG 11-48b" /LENGTH=755 /DNA_ID=CAMNT_0049600665 /DNA_START=139 /DNA_END=2406 /DNA_ORIENTATION=-
MGSSPRTAEDHGAHEGDLDLDAEEADFLKCMLAESRDVALDVAPLPKSGLPTGNQSAPSEQPPALDIAAVNGKILHYDHLATTAASLLAERGALRMDRTATASTSAPAKAPATGMRQAMLGTSPGGRGMSRTKTPQASVAATYGADAAVSKQDPPPVSSQPHEKEQQQQASAVKQLRPAPNTIPQLETQLAAAAGAVSAAATGSTAAGQAARRVSELSLRLCRLYNTTAMQLVNINQLPDAYELLQKACLMCEPLPGVLAHEQHGSNPSPEMAATLVRWRAITYNNLGVYYKRKGKPQAALQFLRQAAELEGVVAPDSAGAPSETGSFQSGSASTAVENPAGTLLNLCATLSSMGRHDEALAHAQEAVDLIYCAQGVTQQEAEKVVLAQARANGSSGSAARNGSLAAPPARSAATSCSGEEWQGSNAGKDTPSHVQAASGGMEPKGTGGVADDEVANQEYVWTVLKRMRGEDARTLCAGLYNRAVELEHLGQLPEAVAGYTAAAATAAALLGRNSGLAQTMYKALQAVKGRLRAEGRAKAAAGRGGRPGAAAGSRRANSTAGCSSVGDGESVASGPSVGSRSSRGRTPMAMRRRAGPAPGVPAHPGTGKLTPQAQRQQQQQRPVRSSLLDGGHAGSMLPALTTPHLQGACGGTDAPKTSAWVQGLDPGGHRVVDMEEATTVNHQPSMHDVEAAGSGGGADGLRLDCPSNSRAAPRIDGAETVAAAASVQGCSLEERMAVRQQQLRGLLRGPGHGR